MMFDRSFGSMVSQSRAYHRRTASSRSRQAASGAPVVSTSTRHPERRHLVAQIRFGGGADRAAAELSHDQAASRRSLARPHSRCGRARASRPAPDLGDSGDLDSVQR